MSVARTRWWKIGHRDQEIDSKSLALLTGIVAMKWVWLPPCPGFCSY